jgi:CubicO group peptidase (beta-lactamase class C family)
VKTGVTPTQEDLNAFFQDRELFFEPGSNYSYCNSGFLLMGWIIERVTGNSLQNEIDRVINEPTGMKLRLIREAVNDPNMAPYWELKKDSNFIPYPHWTWIKGDGGITATTIMLAQFPRQWAHGKIISDSSFQEMITPIVLIDGVQTGYGIGVRNGEFYGEKIIGHTGGNKSTYAIMLYFPERDLSVAVCMNTDHTPVSVRNIFREFTRVVMGKDVPDLSSQEVPLEGFQKYVGIYYTFDYKNENAISIEVNSDHSRLNYCVNHECEPMIHTGNNKFCVNRWPYDLIEFHVDEEGKALAIKEYYSGFYAVLRKRKK